MRRAHQSRADGVIGFIHKLYVPHGFPRALLYDLAMSKGKAADQTICYPTEVRRQSAEKQMRVTWNDGHVSDYPWTYVRGWCPCAACQGHSGERHYIPNENPELVSIEVVGKYALGLAWSDGHDSGIYSYRYLRELCTCSECEGAGLQ